MHSTAKAGGRGHACIGARCRKEQVTAEAVYPMRSCRSFVLFFVLTGPGARPWTRLRTRGFGSSWLLEVFWKAFELEVTHGPRPRQSGPQDKEVASALPRFSCFWLCRTPVANQVRQQRSERIDMSCLQCLLKHVQAGVTF